MELQSTITYGNIFQIQIMDKLVSFEREAGF